MSNKFTDYVRGTLANGFTREAYLGLGAVIGLEATFAIASYAGYEIDRSYLDVVLETILISGSIGCLIGTGLGLETYHSLRKAREKFDGLDEIPLDSLAAYIEMYYCSKVGLELAAKDANLENPKGLTSELIARKIEEDPESFGKLSLEKKENIVRLLRWHQVDPPAVLLELIS